MSTDRQHPHEGTTTMTVTEARANYADALAVARTAQRVVDRAHADLVEAATAAGLDADELVAKAGA